MQTAFYIGKGKPLNYLIRFVQRVKGTANWHISHCETVMQDLGDGFYLCGSASAMDGGVRIKAIDLNNGNWIITGEPRNEERAWALYKALNGDHYDYIGAFKHILPFLNSDLDKWFCSEICARVLGLTGEPSPAELYNDLTKNKDQ